MKMLSNTEAELKKALLIKKKVCISMDTIDENLVLKIEIIRLSASVNVIKDCFFHTLFMS